MSLKSTYGGFESIIGSLKNGKVSKDFWEKEKNNIKKRVEEGRREKESMKMTTQKFYKAFSL